MLNKDYLKIVNHYENCFHKHGDNNKGVDWPNVPDMMKRYDIMLGLLRDEKSTLLDFGCGTAMLYDVIQKSKFKDTIKYSGYDMGRSFIKHCRQKFPEINFYEGDFLEDDTIFPDFDYIIMNGIFTEKRECNFESMWTYFKTLLTQLFKKANKGIAFNVMSKHVDWERDDLFHLPFDKLAGFLCKDLTRNFIIRNDYGLYEYTVYLYKK